MFISWLAPGYSNSEADFGSDSCSVFVYIFKIHGLKFLLFSNFILKFKVFTFVCFLTLFLKFTIFSFVYFFIIRCYVQANFEAIHFSYPFHFLKMYRKIIILL